MTQRPAFFYSPPSYNPHEHYVFPVLLLARRAVEEAWECSKKKFQNGEPCEDAVDSLRWLETTTDWTRLRRLDGSVPVPPREIQPEFVFTFDWCCRLLETTPEKVRAVGLPTTRLFHANPTVGGLAAIYENWAAQRSAWLGKQESAPNLEMPLPSACCHCGKEVPEDRLRRGSSCCSKDCHDADRYRKAKMRMGAKTDHTPEVPLPSTFAPEPPSASDFTEPSIASPAC